MNFSPEICSAAQRVIDSRRLEAQTDLENRREEVFSKLPEVREIDEKIKGTVVHLSKMIISRKVPFDDAFMRIKKNNTGAQIYLRALLTRNGYPEDYLDIKYHCNECSDTGFLESGKRCGCFYDLAGRLSAEALNRSANMPECDFSHFDLNYYSKLPDPNNSDIIPYNKMTEVYNYCLKYVHTFGPDSVSLLMIGKTGIGKTHLSLSIAKAVAGKGFVCAYGSVLNYLNDIEAEHFGRADPQKNTLQTLFAADLLILDDLGAENSGSFYESTLYNIINTRINLRKPVIISSNIDTNVLKNMYDDRIISRIFGVYEILRFYGTDIRQMKKLGK